MRTEQFLSFLSSHCKHRTERKTYSNESDVCAEYNQNHL